MSKRGAPCSVCGARLKKQEITYAQAIGEAVYVVIHVPADVCPQCGEQYLAPDTVDSLQAVVGGSAVPKKTIDVPVYEFARAPARG